MLTHGPLTVAQAVAAGLSLAQMDSLFLHPALAATGAAAVAAPLVIHLLARARRRPQPWGAMRLILEAARQERTRLRLRQWLLLVLRCLIVILLGLALARPLSRGFLSALGHPQEHGRRVAVVIDDSYAASAPWGATAASGDVMRLARGRAAAGALLDALDSGDRVLLLRLSETVDMDADRRIDADGFPPHDARTRLDGIEPTLGPAQPRRAWEQALRAAASWLTRTPDAATTSAPRRKPILAIASHGSQALLDALETVDRSAHGSTSVARSREALEPAWLLTRPAASVPNLQIEDVQIERSGRPSTRVLTTSTSGAGALDAQQAPVRVSVRRVGPTEAPMHVRLVAGLAAIAPSRNDAHTQPVMMEASATLQLAADQRQASTTLLVPIPPMDVENSAKAQPPHILTVRLVEPGSSASEPWTQVNVLPGDDVRHRWVELAGPLAVGLVDEDASTSPSRAGELPSAAWWRVALRPRSTAGRSLAQVAEQIAVTRVLPAALAQTLRHLEPDSASLDALIVLRPDLLERPTCSTLAAWTRSGGILWIMPPAESGVDETAWAEAILEELGVGGGLGPMAVSADPAGWALASAPPPAELGLLGAEWDALVGPVRVHRAWTWRDAGLGIASGSGNEESDGRRAAAGFSPLPWLRLRTGEPWLVHHPIGDGHVLLGLSAFEPRWTNLPTRPLFVPLVHEALHTLATGRPLDARWRSAWAHGPSDAAVAAIGLKLDDQAQPHLGAVLLDVAPDAGDTQAADVQRLVAALDALTAAAPLEADDAPRRAWAWLDADEAAAALAGLERTGASQAGADLGRPLLLLALALLVAEGVLARLMTYRPAEPVGGER